MTNIFNRYEFKYLIDLKTYAKLKMQLSSFTMPDSFSTDGEYSILSLYHDSKNYDCYYTKIDGEKQRQKLRIRWYLSKSKGYIGSYLELKKKYNNKVLKKRLKINETITDKFLKGKVYPDEICKNENDLDIANEILYYYEIMKLRPEVYVHYFREAYCSKYENGLRITFDKKISASAWRTRKFSFDRKRNVFNPFYMIMEVKFFNSMPLWLVNILNSNNLVERSLSKYCMSIETVNLLKTTLKES